MNSSRRADLLKTLEDHTYRHAFLRRHMPETLAAQIREMREQRHWSQEELGRHANMKQTRISRLEDPDYGSYTLETLTRLAEAFDVGLTVRFSAFSELIDWTAKLTRERLAPPSFDNDAALRAAPLSDWDAVQTGPEGVFGIGSVAFSGELMGRTGLLQHYSASLGQSATTVVFDAFARRGTKQKFIEDEVLYDRVA